MTDETGAALTEESAEVDVKEAEAQEVEQVEVSATSDSGQETEESKKAKSGFQKRIDQITREKYELKQQLEQQRQEAEQLRQAQMQKQLQESGDIPMPKLADYDYDESAYGQAVQQWHQAMVKAQNEKYHEFAQQQDALQKQHQRQASIAAKLSQAQEKYPDFMVKVNNPELPSLQQINQTAFEAVLESDKFADVAMFLASNPSELYQLGNLSPIAAVKRIAQIENQVSSTATQGAVPPPPPSTVGGKGESVRDPQKMSTAEWMAWRNKQVKRR